MIELGSKNNFGPSTRRSNGVFSNRTSAPPDHGLFCASYSLTCHTSVFAFTTTFGWASGVRPTWPNLTGLKTRGRLASTWRSTACSPRDLVCDLSLNIYMYMYISTALILFSLSLQLSLLVCKAYWSLWAATVHPFNFTQPFWVTFWEHRCSSSTPPLSAGSSTGKDGIFLFR